MQVRRKRSMKADFPVAKRACFETSAPRIPQSRSSNSDPIGPMNKKACQERYKTFTSTKWHCKPPSASAWRCARWGWVCVAKNHLKCVACGSCVRARDFRKEDLKVENFRHKQGCAFQTTQSPVHFSHLPATKIECEEEFIRNLKTFNITDTKNQYLIPSVCEEIQGTMVAELPMQKQHLATEGILLAACGWQLRDRRPKGANVSTEHFRLGCACCDRSFPLSALRLKPTSELIPDKGSAFADPVAKNAQISPFSIDNAAPLFGCLEQTFSRVSFWEEEKDVKKRKREDDPLPLKKVKQNKPKSMEKQKMETRKRFHAENVRPKKKRRISSFDSRKRASDSNFENERSKKCRMKGGYRLSSAHFDPIKSHRPSCPYAAHYGYPTGNGEVPGYVHSLRCVGDLLNAAILKTLISS